MLLKAAGKQKLGAARAALYLALPAHGGRPHPLPAHNHPPGATSWLPEAGPSTLLLTGGMQEECRSCRTQHKLSLLLLVRLFSFYALCLGRDGGGSGGGRRSGGAAQRGGGAAGGRSNFPTLRFEH